jgi:hypothetical protein
LLGDPDVPSRWPTLDLGDAPPPLLTINCRWKNSTVRLLSALTIFGAALDIALQELRIGSSFPVAEATRAALMTARSSRSSEAHHGLHLMTEPIWLPRCPPMTSEVMDSVFPFSDTAGVAITITAQEATK